MTTTHVLAFPNNDDPFIRDTDASDIAIGVALYQIQNGVERPVSLASHNLTSAQTRYCTTRKSLLSIVVFTGYYKHYLLGREFTVRTDHGSLTWLFRFKLPEGQLGRRLEELSQLSMPIQHRAGVVRCNADGVSRIPEELEHCSCYEAEKYVSSLPCGGCAYCRILHSRWGRFEVEVDYFVPLAVRQVKHNNTVQTNTADNATDEDKETIYVNQFNPQELRGAQLLDGELCPVIHWLEGEPLPKTISIHHA